MRGKSSIRIRGHWRSPEGPWVSRSKVAIASVVELRRIIGLEATLVIAEDETIADATGWPHQRAERQGAGMQLNPVVRGIPARPETRSAVKPIYSRPSEKAASRS